MKTGTYTDNELTICKKKPVISEMDSIWVPENIIVELIPVGKKGTSQAFLSGAKVRYSQSLFVIGPHYVDPLKKCGIKKWAKMIITSKDNKTCDLKEPLHGRNYVRYCSGRAGSGLCLQAVTKDKESKFLWKRTMLSRETNMVSTEGEDLSPPCKIKPRSYIIPVDKSIVICKEGYKKNGPYSSRSQRPFTDHTLTGDKEDLLLVDEKLNQNSLQCPAKRKPELQEWQQQKSFLP